jgi:hypothetical protein
MNNLLTFIAIVGTVETIILICATIYGIVLCIRGILPVLIRLGNGLAKREIAIFAKGDNVESLKNLLLDSKLFREKNIRVITKKEDMEIAKRSAVYLVFWSDWANDIDEILKMKPDECSLNIYAPFEKGRVPDEQMVKMDGKRHTAVANFRGRLLNDIVSSMITTSYEL